MNDAIDGSPAVVGVLWVLAGANHKLPQTAYGAKGTCLRQVINHKRTSHAGHLAGCGTLIADTCFDKVLPAVIAG
jgi:hypothetical protein